MFTRKLLPALEKHLNIKQVTVITGLRRVGKSTALKYLFQKSETNNKIYLDLERLENQAIFLKDSYKDIERDLELLGFDFSKPGLIAIDEIQMVKTSSSVIKAFYDDFGIKFIVTGSSSFYLKNHFSESLAGRKRIFEMTPLDFEEFLWFKNKKTHKIQAEKMKPFFQTFYDLYKDDYDEYLKFGGFPEVVLAADNDDKIQYLKDILNSHIELDVRLLGDVSSSDVLYKLIHLLANRVGSKIDYSKIASLLGVNRNKVKDYILLLEYTYLIKKVPVFSQSIEIQIAKQDKMYFTDNGLLQICGQLSSGAIFENALANQLANLGEIQYYEKNIGTEIDFILNKTTAFEVKETPSDFDYNTLKKRAKAVNITDYHLIGRKLAPSGYKNFIWGGSLF
jgi:uncharacterized protein